MWPSSSAIDAWRFIRREIREISWNCCGQCRWIRRCCRPIRARAWPGAWPRTAPRSTWAPFPAPMRETWSCWTSGRPERAAGNKHQCFTNVFCLFLLSPKWTFSTIQVVVPFEAWQSRRLTSRSRGSDGSTNIFKLFIQCHLFSWN